MATLRTTAPDNSNKYFKQTAYGGVNPCIHISNGSVLPNCVGYVFGAWYEMLGSKPKLSQGNAKTFYTNTGDGYTRSKTPELGAVACWGGGTYGHVAVVVGIHSDHITVAQSNYGGVRWEIVNCYKMSNGLYKSHGGNTNMQGFILLPAGHKISTSTSSNTSTAKSGKISYWNLSSKYGKGKKFVVRNTNDLGLNMRSTPSTSGKVLKNVPDGTALYYYGRGAMNGNVCWYYVQEPKSKVEAYVYGGVYKSGKAPYLLNAEP